MIWTLHDTSNDYPLVAILICNNTLGPPSTGRVGLGHVLERMEGVAQIRIETFDGQGVAPLRMGQGPQHQDASCAFLLTWTAKNLCLAMARHGSGQVDGYKGGGPRHRDQKQLDAASRCGAADCWVRHPQNSG